jgi:probable rRNA maturation factor
MSASAKAVAKKAAAKKPAARKVSASKAPAPPALTLSLQFADPRHREQLPRHAVARWVRAALERPAQVTVRIVDAAEGRELNRGYRGKDYATNVLTFDYEHEPLVVADLVLCAPVVAAEARAQRLPVAQHYAHLLVHGTLHAQGYDHETEADAQVMEGRESAVMLGMNLPDPYRRR